jgi:excisionase family DNA binding protein
MGINSSIRRFKESEWKATAGQGSSAHSGSLAPPAVIAPSVPAGSAARQSREFRLWTTEEVARFLNVSKRWVEQKVAEGRIAHVRLGRLIRFDPKTVRAFAEGHGHGANAAVRGRR